MVGWEEFTELEPMELLVTEQGMVMGVEDMGEAIEVEGEREVVGAIYNKISPHNQSCTTFPNSSIHPASSNNMIYLNQDLYQFLMKLPSWMMSEPLCKLALPLAQGTTTRAISLD